MNPQPVLKLITCNSRCNFEAAQIDKLCTCIYSICFYFQYTNLFICFRLWTWKLVFLSSLAV